jgi:hypothetical protein
MYRRHPDPKFGFTLRAIAAEKIARRRELHHEEAELARFRAAGAVEVKMYKM